MSGLQQLQFPDDSNSLVVVTRFAIVLGLPFLSREQVCCCLTVLLDESAAVTHMDKTLPHCSARAKSLDNEKEEINWSYIFLPLCWA